MSDEEVRRMFGTAGLGVWGPGGAEGAPGDGAGLWGRARARLSALAGVLGQGRAGSGRS